MLQILPRFRIDVRFNPSVTYVLYLNDNFIENVLRKLADISYEGVPIEISITRMTDVQIASNQTITEGGWKPC